MADRPVKLRQLSTKSFKVTKKRSGGVIEYNLFVDSDEQLYLRMIDNTKDGSFSCRAFAISRLLNDLSNGSNEFQGIDENGISDRALDKNNKAFLEVVVEQLLPGILGPKIRT